MQLNLTTLILRFYLLMAVVIVALFAGIPWLALLALPIFFSALMGIPFKRPMLKAKTGQPGRTKNTFTAEPQTH